MNQVPRIRQLKQQLQDAETHMMQLKRSIDAATDAPNKLKHFLREHNYIGLADNQPATGVALKVPSADDLVLSIAVCSPKTPNERTQEIEFLGSQSLLEI